MVARASFFGAEKGRLSLFIILLIVLYSVGLIGFSFSSNPSFFYQLTPINLIISFIVLLVFQQNIDKKFILISIFIAISGYLIEVLGVQTGVIFGEYSYGKSLGIKLFDTPLLIGINWLMLSLSTYIIVCGFKLKAITGSLIAAFLMVAYDFALEPVAIQTGMWMWEKGFIPIQNYLAWFAISFVFVRILYGFQISKNNKIAFYLFIIQFLFFILLNLKAFF